MAHANKVEGILVDLDSLLDTRLGTLSGISPDLARQALTAPGYLTRTTDTFVGVEEAVYKAAYAQRDIQTLKQSVMTGIVSYLRSILKQLKDQAVTQPTHDAIRVDVNVFPYDPSPDELAVLHEVLLYRLTGGMATEAQEFDLVTVDIVNYSPESLTPAHCKANYGALVMYDPWNWLNLHSEAFPDRTKRLPEVILYAPRLYSNREPNEKELSDLKMELRNIPDPFTSLEMAISPIVGLTLIDVVHFSSSVRPR